MTTWENQDLILETAKEALEVNAKMFCSHTNHDEAVEMIHLELLTKTNLSIIKTSNGEVMICDLFQVSEPFIVI